MVTSPKCENELGEQGSEQGKEGMASSMMRLDLDRIRVLTKMEGLRIKWVEGTKARVDLTTQDLERTTAPSMPSVREPQE